MRLSIAIILLLLTVSCTSTSFEGFGKQPRMISDIDELKRNVDQVIRVVGTYRFQGWKSPCYIDCGFAKLEITGYVLKEGSPSFSKYTHLSDGDKIEIEGRLYYFKGSCVEAKPVDWSTVRQTFGTYGKVIDGKEYVCRDSAYYLYRVNLLSQNKVQQPGSAPDGTGQ